MDSVRAAWSNVGLHTLAGAAHRNAVRFTQLLLLGVLASLSMMLGWMVCGEPWFAAGAAGAAVALVAVRLLLVHRPTWTRVLRHTVLGMVVLLTVCSAMSTGQATSPIAVYLVVLPTLLAYGGRSSEGAWLIVACVLGLCTLVAGQAFWPIASLITIPPLMVAVFLAVAAMLTAVVSTQARAEFDEARVALVHARDLAVAESQAKSDFLAAVSHEIRTPLHGIVGMVESLTPEASLETHRDAVSVIAHSSHALAELVNQVLDLNRVDAGAFELHGESYRPTMLAQEVVELFEAQASMQGVVLVCNGPLDATAFGDRQRMRQVLCNLVGNAVKFTPHGHIEVSVEVVDDEVSVEVVDTGIGIPAASLERIFDPYAQASSDISARFGGTGLGLALCRKLVEKMGGSLHVRSQVAQGTTFWLSVPRGHTTKGPVAEPVQPDRQPAQSEKILVVDDNPVNRLVAEKMLESLGYGVVVVESGEAAVGTVDRHAFVAVLMDVMMPGITGVEATRRIRRESRVPVIGLTAAATPEVEAACMDAGMTTVLHKPLRRQTLRRALRALPVAPPQLTVSRPPEVC